MYRKQLDNTLGYRKRVLVIEDDAWIRSFMRDVLSDEGYEVIEAADGRTGIRLIEQHSPNIVLLDIAMPEFTGVDVLCHLRSKQRTRSLPVVIMSAYQHVLPPKDAGSVACILIKPVHVEDLLAVVRQVLESDEVTRSGRAVVDAAQIPATPILMA